MKTRLSYKENQTWLQLSWFEIEKLGNQGKKIGNTG